MKPIFHDANGKEVYVFTPNEYEVVKRCLCKFNKYSMRPVVSTTSECEYCGTRVASETLNCPNCGAPIRKRERVETIDYLDGLPVYVVTEEQKLMWIHREREYKRFKGERK